MKFAEKLKYTLIIIIVLSSCGVPKEVMDSINSRPKVMVEFPLDYCIDLCI